MKRRAAPLLPTYYDPAWLPADALSKGAGLIASSDCEPTCDLVSPFRQGGIATARVSLKSHANDSPKPPQSFPLLSGGVQVVLRHDCITFHQLPPTPHAGQPRHARMHQLHFFLPALVQEMTLFFILPQLLPFFSFLSHADYDFCRMRVITVRKRKSSSIQCKHKEAWKGNHMMCNDQCLGATSNRIWKPFQRRSRQANFTSGFLLVDCAEGKLLSKSSNYCWFYSGGRQMYQEMHQRCANSPSPCAAPGKCLRQIARWDYGSKDRVSTAVLSNVCGNQSAATETRQLVKNKTKNIVTWIACVEKEGRKVWNSFKIACFLFLFEQN